MSTLATSGLTMRFGGLRALGNVTVDFSAARITGLIGPNGSGKSTLVNVLSGQFRPTAGTFHFDGTDLTGQRADRIVRRGLVRTYQIPHLPPQLTIGEVIRVPLTYIKRPAARQLAMRDPAEIAAFCGIRQPLETPCAELPVTDLRRLEIARAVACAPSMLLLDEVMAGLSHEDSQQVVALVRTIHAAGVGVVIIEHVMRIISDLCDHVVVMNNGQVLRTGLPREVLADDEVRTVYLGTGFKL